MKIISEKQILDEKEKFIELIREGKIFIYPTDTIYGIGCNALISESVSKIREMKKRDSKPFSVIAPSKEWIRENCFVNSDIEKWLNKLPGPYTLILKTKNKNCVAKEVNLDAETLGVRIPKHWFYDLIKEAEVPFVTTSVNISGEKYLEDLQDLKEEIKNKVDFIINEGKKDSKPSTIVDLTGKEKIIRK